MKSIVNGKLFVTYQKGLFATRVEVLTEKEGLLVQQVTWFEKVKRKYFENGNNGSN